MLKKALVALALFMLPVTGALAQTAGQSVMGFLLMPGNTYNGYTCPSSNVGPCFVQYGSSIPTGGGTATQIVEPYAGASTDISGTVAAGGVYQTAAAASATRKNCTIQNPSSATEALLVKFGTMTQPYSLGAGQSISSLNGVVTATDAITVTAATLGHAFAGTCQ